MFIYNKQKTWSLLQGSIISYLYGPPAYGEENKQVNLGQIEKTIVPFKTIAFYSLFLAFLTILSFLNPP